jgi:hypothetical protein
VRIVCFILGVLSIAACGAMVVLGISAGTSASSTAHTLRATPSLEAASTAAINDTRADAYALAQIFGLVGVAWMVGAAAFATNRRSGLADDMAAQPAQQWAAQFAPQQRPYPGDNPQYPGSGPEPPTTRLNG